MKKTVLLVTILTGSFAVLYVNIARAAGPCDNLPTQATGIALLYAALVALGTLACFLMVAAGTTRGSLEASQEALLFAYTALNFPIMYSMKLVVSRSIQFSCLYMEDERSCFSSEFRAKCDADWQSVLRCVWKRNGVGESTVMVS